MSNAKSSSHLFPPRDSFVTVSAAPSSIEVALYEEMEALPLFNPDLDLEPGPEPVALMNASARTEYAQAALREVLKTMDARLVSDAEITVPLLGKGLGAAGIAADPKFSGLISRCLQRIAEECVNANVASEKVRG